MSKNVFNLFVFFLVLSVGVCYWEISGAEDRGSFESLFKPYISEEGERKIEIKKFAVELVQNDPELANRIFDLPLVNESFLGKLIEDTNLKLKAFEPDDKDDSASLGFSYSYAKNYKMPFNKNKQSVNYSGIDLAFQAKGNVAFDEDVNPNDFLDTKLNWSYFSSRGGVSGKITDPSTLTKLDYLRCAMTNMVSFDNFKKSTEWQEYKDIIGKNLTDQYYFHIGMDGGLESDQSFDKKQYTYGAKAGLVARGWGEESILGKFNVLDYIPALIRRYSGVDDQWRPRGSTFPSVLLGVDRVTPDGNDPRTKIGDDSDFTRLTVEASFKTQLTEWKTDPVYVEANFRYYHELDAKKSVKDADLDDFNYFTIALRLPQNIFVSYATGKLPLDASNDQVYSIGLNYNF
ncbi:MAG: hypothetical protein JRD93_19545 [Deltaproteobacteria bacterium]|nr:hypothetical protein [Deltaproteobacteria bacterium]